MIQGGEHALAGERPEQVLLFASYARVVFDFRAVGVVIKKKAIPGSVHDVLLAALGTALVAIDDTVFDVLLSDAGVHLLEKVAVVEARSALV